MNSEISQEQISMITSKLINVYNPDEMYLFGSYAWGAPDKDSDIDICVFLTNANFDKAERIRVGLRALRGIRIPVDILVYTWKEIEENRNHPSSLFYKILNNGVKLYEAV